MRGNGLQTGGPFTILLKKRLTQKAHHQGKTGWRKVDPTCAISPTAIGIAALLEARIHLTALLPIWDSAVPPTACLPWAKRREEPVWIQEEVVSNLYSASLRTLSNLTWGIPTTRWVTYLPNGQRNCHARPNLWPASAYALYCVVRFWRSLPCVTFGSLLKRKGVEGTLRWASGGLCPSQTLPLGLDPGVPCLTFLGLRDLIYQWKNAQHDLWGSLQLTNSMSISDSIVIS